MDNSNGWIVYITDTETTGLLAKEHDVIEISMARLYYVEGKAITEQKTWCIKAMNPLTIQDEALKINGHKREDILHLTKEGKERYLMPKDVINDIEKWIMEDEVSATDRIFAGQNPIFDAEFLQELWLRNDCTTFPFALEKNNRILDTRVIAVFIDICTQKRRQYYNLGSLVKSFGVKKLRAHSAADDVTMTKNLLIAYMDPLRELIASTFKDCYNEKE